jgi:hypothetical protein
MKRLLGRMFPVVAIIALLAPTTLMSDKLQFVASSGKTLPSQVNDKLKFVGRDAVETKTQRDARMKWWRAARFGVHSLGPLRGAGRNIPIRCRRPSRQVAGRA